jgi:hypothetical protein
MAVPIDPIAGPGVTDITSEPANTLTEAIGKSKPPIVTDLDGRS